MDYRDIKRSDIENAVGYALLKDILEAKKFLTVQEKRNLVIIISASGIVNENLIGKIQDGVKRLRNIGGAIKDEALVKIEQLAGKAQGFADWMSTALVGLSTRSLEYFKQKFKASKDECLILIKKDDSFLTGKIDAFRKEVDQLKQTIDFWTADFPQQMALKIKTLYSKYLVKESLSESDSNDKKGGQENPDFGFVSKATAALTKLPPFSFLGQVEDWSTMTNEKTLMLFSQLTAKLGGPGIFRLSIISSVCNVFVKSQIKGKVHNFIDHIVDEAFEAEKLLKLLPGVKIILTTIGYIAMFASIQEVCQTLLDFETQKGNQNDEPVSAQPVALATHDSSGKREPINGRGNVAPTQVGSKPSQVANEPSQVTNTNSGIPL